MTKDFDAMVVPYRGGFPVGKDDLEFLAVMLNQRAALSKRLLKMEDTFGYTPMDVPGYDQPIL